MLTYAVYTVTPLPLWSTAYCPDLYQSVVTCSQIPSSPEVAQCSPHAFGNIAKSTVPLQPQGLRAGGPLAVHHIVRHCTQHTIQQLPCNSLSPNAHPCVGHALVQRLTTFIVNVQRRFRPSTSTCLHFAVAQAIASKAMPKAQHTMPLIMWWLAATSRG